MEAKLAPDGEAENREEISDDHAAPASPPSPRRKFLKFLGWGVAGTWASILPSPGLSATWQKINSSAAGGGLKWRKISAGTTAQVGVAAIQAGANHSLAIQSDGLLFSSGLNSFGQLGHGTVVSRSSFVQATGISGVVSLGGGANHSTAIRSDGLAFAAGRNNYGQLGDNTTISRSTFIQCIGVSGVVAIAVGFGHNVALRSDGQIYACGYNTLGALGDKSATDR